jgi:Mycothiol maleylpyruvate isomerase N-terminal domain
MLVGGEPEPLALWADPGFVHRRPSSRTDSRRRTVDGAVCRSARGSGEGGGDLAVSAGGHQPSAKWTLQRALAVFRDGVTVICEITGQLPVDGWNAPTPCTEWRMAELAAHLRCMADDYHEYLDDAPVSRLARLMATGAPPETLARKLARQNAAELAALPDATGLEHIEAFAASARSYAQRLPSHWNLPHHMYRGYEVTVGGMAGVACAEWHLHAWDLVRAMKMDYRPAYPELLASGWHAGLPHLPLPPGDPWEALLTASGRSP